MLEPSRHERDGHPSVVIRHFLIPPFANFKAGAGHINKAVQNCSQQEICVDGTVVSRTVEIGQTVTASSDAQPLFLIATDPSTSK